MAKPRFGKPVRGSASGRPLMVLLDLLGRRWVLRLLWEFSARERMSFNELRARTGGISPSVLSQRLRDLQDADLLGVDEAGWYALTGSGRELREPLETLAAWSKRWAKRVRR
jgi:DNA-binding HxlR family transcriptional regulator